MVLVFPVCGSQNLITLPSLPQLAARYSFLQMEQVSWVHSLRARNSCLQVKAQLGHWCDLANPREIHGRNPSI